MQARWAQLHYSGWIFFQNVEELWTPQIVMIQPHVYMFSLMQIWLCHISCRNILYAARMTYAHSALIRTASHDVWRRYLFIVAWSKNLCLLLIYISDAIHILKKNSFLHFVSFQICIWILMVYTRQHKPISTIEEQKKRESAFHISKINC